MNLVFQYNAFSKSGYNTGSAGAARKSCLLGMSETAGLSLIARLCSFNLQMRKMMI